MMTSGRDVSIRPACAQEEDRRRRRDGFNRVTQQDNRIVPPVMWLEFALRDLQ
jgi:hypothetical protein